MHFHQIFQGQPLKNFTWSILEYHNIYNKEMTLSKGNKTLRYTCVMTFVLANNRNVLVGKKMRAFS